MDQSRKICLGLSFSSDCVSNSRFIKKRHYMEDYSVDHSIYLYMNAKTFENYVPLQDLKYTGVKVPPQNHTDPEKLTLSWVEKVECEEALSTSLGVVEEIDFSRKLNYYVIYGAIDLMNYHYTSQDQTGKVVSE